MKFYVKNFGPLNKGTVDEIEITPYMVFIGSEGSGKSTLAKLLSSFEWLEKSLVKGNLNIKKIERKNYLHKFLEFHRISSYLKLDTEICYEGQYYRFKYQNERLEITDLEIKTKQISKVIYIPAERNILSISNGIKNIQSYPQSLRAFWEMYYEFCERLRADFPLPIDYVNFSYDRLNKIALVKQKSERIDYKIRLTEAASGYQSLIPLYGVSYYLYNLINTQPESSIDNNLYIKLKSEVERIANNEDLTEEVKSIMLKNVSLRFKYSHLVNIMEEPELNLYPASQKSEIEALVKLNNSNPKHRLVITTHSPYVLTTFNNLLYAGMLAQNHPDEIGRIISKDIWIEKGKLSAFEIIDGQVISIMDKKTGLIQAEMIDKISNQSIKILNHFWNMINHYKVCYEEFCTTIYR